ncbi:hypothetical protein SAMN04487897_11047 [Paenibacillus sp. yr247]|nr:hypothetical protein SAMN04487897_11047 [Paenibacillus sp. yr247]
MIYSVILEQYPTKKPIPINKGEKEYDYSSYRHVWMIIIFNVINYVVSDCIYCCELIIDSEVILHKFYLDLSLLSESFNV